MSYRSKAAGGKTDRDASPDVPSACEQGDIPLRSGHPIRTPGGRRPAAGVGAYNRAVDSDHKASAAENRERIDSRNEPAAVHSPGRVLGLDVGSRRIGIAVSDPLGITAQGLETLERRNKRHDFEHLQRVIREYEVKEIVVGLPLRMSGAEGAQAGKMRAFAEELRKRFGLRVHLWDERLTSAEANRFLRETELSIEKRGKAVDRMAAVLILQGWMERRSAVRG
jgi:putative pre-16S rRNA nuclease